MSFARAAAAIAALGLVAAGCSGDGQAEAGTGWVNRTLYAASTIEVGAGVAAVTALGQDRKLQTVVLDLAQGEELWDEPATMAGRLSGLGVQPPAIVDGPDGSLVVAVEPLDEQKADKRHSRPGTRAALVARDARTGAEQWSRPIHSTFGPAACGSHVCLAENTARQDARFVVLDPRTGQALWRAPGVAEMEYADESSVVLMTMDDNPTLQARRLDTGRVKWKVPLSRLVGGDVSLTGGWDFATVGKRLVGYVGPYRETAQAELPGFGFFAVEISSGRVAWKRHEMVRLYPSPAPSALLLTRQVVGSGRGYGAFVRIDPATGRPAARIPVGQIPKFEWWVGYSRDLQTIGFVSGGRAGAAFDLRSGRPVAVEGRTVWSYCSRNPQQLPIVGHDGFYATAALCEFDLENGQKVEDAGPPPTWVTGTTDGWRVWHDETGAVHGVKDGSGTSPGIYG